MPQISVVIPTYNRLDRLRDVISALERQEFPRDAFEIIIVSDGSSDGTNDYLQSLRSTSQVRPLIQPNRGPAAARNAGVAHASGEFIVFIDDDVVPQPQLLAAHMQAHRDAGREVAVLGPLLSPEGYKMSPWVGWEQTTLMKQYNDMLLERWNPTARQFYTGNVSLRRKNILAAGGFDEKFRRAEDVELAYRLASQGIGFVFTMKAVGLHFAERSFRSWLDAAYMYGRNDVMFGRNRHLSWIPAQTRREFHLRHVLVQRLVRTCLGRRRATSLATHALKLMAHTGAWIGSAGVERYACSGLFNLRYYQGFCDELGDPEFLFRTTQSEGRP